MRRSVRRALMKIARRVLEGVKQTIDQQINVIQQDVLDYLLNYVNQTDSMWRGDDAEVFVAEFNGKVAPVLRQLVGATGNFRKRIGEAEERIDLADQRICSMVDDLVNDFSAIYS